MVRENEIREGESAVDMPAGPVAAVLSEERLAALCEAPVATMREPGGRTAFLPG